MTKHQPTWKLFLFLSLLSGVIYLLSPQQASAWCAQQDVGGMWTNPFETNHIEEASIGLICYDDGSRGSIGTLSIKYTNGYTNEIGIDEKDDEGKSVSAYTTYTTSVESHVAEVMSNGWLKITTRFDYYDSSKVDIVKVDYLARSLDFFDSDAVKALGQVNVAVCGVGCITGKDVQSATFVYWDSQNQPQTVTDSDGPLFCIRGDNHRCHDFSAQLTDVEVQIHTKNGRSVRFAPEGSYYLNQIKPIWPYPIQQTSISANQVSVVEIKPLDGGELLVLDINSNEVFSAKKRGNRYELIKAALGSKKVHSVAATVDGTVYGLTVEENKVVKLVDNFSFALMWTAISNSVNDIFIGSSVYINYSGDLYRYDVKNKNWDEIGRAGAKHIAIDRGLVKLNGSGSRALLWSERIGSWEELGGNFADIHGGQSKILATNVTGQDIFLYNFTSDSWSRIGDPGNQYAITDDGRVFKLSLSKDKILQWTGNGQEWIQVGGAASSIFASGDHLYGTHPRDAQDVHHYLDQPMKWRSASQAKPSS